ncbi:unnamed protein product [Ceratitis capitata]|uniref:(Mediterranean fruit fly) hypothetical protein n=1 Tax=Ceratitis capitata TaxID=7213 RepID=A0A811UHT9_CERCA|nr:unnamed protein product [Ceratitis capitata]
MPEDSSSNETKTLSTLTQTTFVQAKDKHRNNCTLSRKKGNSEEQKEITQLSFNQVIALFLAGGRLKAPSEKFCRHVCEMSCTHNCH